MIGDELYAWQEQEPGGAWGIIAAVVPQISSAPVPLVARTRVVADRFARVAEAHARASGHDVRLARFAFVEAIT